MAFGAFACLMIRRVLVRLPVEAVSTDDIPFANLETILVQNIIHSSLPEQRHRAAEHCCMSADSATPSRNTAGLHSMVYNKLKKKFVTTDPRIYA